MKEHRFYFRLRIINFAWFNYGIMTLTDKHNGKLLSTGMKMAELPEADHRLLGVIRRLGINFGFGEKTIEEVCAESNVNPHTLLLISKIYIIDDYVPSKEEISRSSMKDIVTYLHNSHHYYMGKALETLEKTVNEMTGNCDEKHCQILTRFYKGYKSEILKHFEYEEATVFPYIKELSEGAVTGTGYRIGQYEESHSNVEEKLNDLKNIVMKYLPQSCDSNLIQDVLDCLYRLEDDLGKHTYIEDEILVPMAAAREKALGVKEK